MFLYMILLIEIRDLFFSFEQVDDLTKQLHQSSVDVGVMDLKL